MSLRRQVLGLVEIVLRVPPLFVIDEILKIGLGLTDITEHDLSDIEERYVINDNTLNYTTTHHDPTFYRFVLISLARFLLSSLGNII